MPNIGCTLQRVVPALLGGGNSTDLHSSLYGNATCEASAGAEDHGEHALSILTRPIYRCR